MASALSSLLGMKPSAGQASMSSPKSDRSRLDVRTIAGDCPFTASRSATGQPDIQQYDVGVQFAGGGNRRCAVRRLTDHLVAVGFQHASRARSEARVVI